MKTVNLNSLDAPRFVEWNGQTYPVRPITPRIAATIDAAAAVEDASAKMVGYYDAVALLVPGMARHEVDNLSIPQVQAIIELASESVHVVEEAAADPNGASSAPTPATEPATAT